MAQSQKTAGRLLRWLSIGLVFAAALEFSARVDDRLAYGAPFFSRYDPDVLREVGADHVPRNVPHARFEKWRINSLGFRGPETPREKPRGVRRIVCLGQSETFGLYEAEGGEWPARLARKIAEAAPGFEVLNASVVGTSRSSRMAYLESDVLPLGPDLVVLLINPLNETTPGSSDPDAGPVADEPAPSPLSWARLRVVEKLKLRLKEALPESWVEAAEAWRVRRSLREIERRELRGRRPLDRVPPAVVESYEAYLRRLVQFLRARGVQPIATTYPTWVHQGDLEAHRAIVSPKRTWHIDFSEEGIVDVTAKLNQATRRVARELAVPLADLDAAVPGSSRYFADQYHYTDAGAEAVAQCVFRALQAAGALEPGWTGATPLRADGGEAAGAGGGG